MEIIDNKVTCSCMNNDMEYPCPYPMLESMPLPYPPMNDMPITYPMHGPMMPWPTANCMPIHPPMPGHMPFPPANCMPHPSPMPPMPIEECDEEMMNHMEKMYCMHMYMSAMNKAEAYRHKMMYCSCKKI